MGRRFDFARDTLCLTRSMRYPAHSSSASRAASAPHAPRVRRTIHLGAAQDGATKVGDESAEQGLPPKHDPELRPESRLHSSCSDGVSASDLTTTHIEQRDAAFARAAEQGLVAPIACAQHVAAKPARVPSTSEHRRSALGRARRLVFEAPRPALRATVARRLRKRPSTTGRIAPHPAGAAIQVGSTRAAATGQPRQASCLDSAVRLILPTRPRTQSWPREAVGYLLRPSLARSTNTPRSRCIGRLRCRGLSLSERPRCPRTSLSSFQR